MNNLKATILDIDNATDANSAALILTHDEDQTEVNLKDGSTYKLPEPVTVTVKDYEGTLNQLQAEVDSAQMVVDKVKYAYDQAQATLSMWQERLEAAQPVVTELDTTIKNRPVVEPTPVEPMPPVSIKN